jgi:hypothetical protein
LQELLFFDCTCYLPLIFCYANLAVQGNCGADKCHDGGDNSHNEFNAHIR